LIIKNDPHTRQPSIPTLQLIFKQVDIKEIKVDGDITVLVMFLHVFCDSCYLSDK